VGGRPCDKLGVGTSTVDVTVRVGVGGVKRVLAEETRPCSWRVVIITENYRNLPKSSEKLANN